ncbi:AcrR family transcriptional regulator [Naumannella cuiyingiana]|uniref:AcrR family transcriptional regulator n=1 Tax=Naumannella cuiyingiana TaxID=1347891 RepID=A0A7Z0D7S2_9ACTN|nr:TetR/AcrR family transcriptional regulator [Naumannella cuiyingiana]NYI70478.1 AcrR family transcriptional regulator [Naumannella cuiyingiana]
MPRVVDQEQRRREITHALWLVIATDGIDAVSLRRVAEAAGVSIGRIQHYFADKDALLLHGIAEFAAAARRAYESVEGDAAERLTRLLTQRIPTTQTGRTAVAIWHSYLGWAPRRTEAVAAVRDAVAAGDRLAAELVSELTGLPPARARERARWLTSAADGLAQRVMLGTVSGRTAIAQVRSAVAGLGQQRAG